MDPLPPRHEIEKRLQQSVVIENDSPHDQIGRIAVHGCDNCGANFNCGVSGLITRLTDVNTFSQALPQPERLITPQGAAVNQDLEERLMATSANAPRLGAAMARTRVSRELELAWAALDERLLHFEQLLRGHNDGNTRNHSVSPSNGPYQELHASRQK